MEKCFIEDSNASVDVFEVNEVHISLHTFKIAVENFRNGENYRRVIGVPAVIILEIIEFEDDIYVGIVLLVLDIEVGNGSILRSSETLLTEFVIFSGVRKLYLERSI